MDGEIVTGDPNQAFTGVSIDTRTIPAGALFFGIRGERFDGADFAERAVTAGAAGVVVPRGRGRGLSRRSAEGAKADVVVIEANDTTAALQSLAHEVRRASGSKVVAITGSAGKTTTK
ncbi:MAG TPA: Mur ligase domain-containing protein, partial [Vicinamibacterales bacterium]|nr:Mur ligase domain-containing protein [Vicinamibacterales bacterium]